MSIAAKLWQPENAVAPYKTLDLNGVTVIRSCHTQNAAVGNLHLNSHLLFVVVGGELCIQHGGRKMFLSNGESAFIKKNSYFSYEKKVASQNQPYQSLLFFFEDELLRHFYKSRREQISPASKNLSIAKVAKNEKLSAFIETVNLYFDAQLANEPELLRLKMLEVLFVLTAANEDLIHCFSQSARSNNDDLARLMETSFNQNLSLAEFAQMSGRSLSTFKRDFGLTFGVAPLRWLREKRLDYAHRLLAATDKNISEICDEAGFENLSHFSRLFKQHFGCRPSCLKKSLHSTKL